MPVKAYIGGMEHAVKHLLYARFVHKFLHDLGLVDCPEPFEGVITQGLVKAKSYFDPIAREYVSPQTAATRKTEDLKITFEKMSKSKLNGISPNDTVAKYGVDVLKMAMIFAGPVDKDINVEENGFNSMVSKL